MRLIESLATTEALAEVFSDRSVLAALLQFEVGLARTQARQSLIPQAAADAITTAAQPDNFDIGTLAADVAGRHTRYSDCEGPDGGGSARRSVGRRVRALGSHQPGCRRYGDGVAAEARTTSAGERPFAIAIRAAAARRRSRFNRHVGTHPDASRAAHHIWTKGSAMVGIGGLVFEAVAGRIFACLVRAVRRSQRHLGCAGHGRRLSRPRIGARSRSEISARALAYTPRRSGTTGMRLRSVDWRSWKNWPRYQPADAKRNRGSFRTRRAGPRRLIDYATQAQSNRVCHHPGVGQSLTGTGRFIP